MMYFYVVQKPMEKMKNAGWIEADSITDARIKVEEQFKAPVGQVSIEFEMTVSEWEEEMRHWPRD